jgi:hypothetical protein
MPGATNVVSEIDPLEEPAGPNIPKPFKSPWRSPRFEGADSTAVSIREFAFDCFIDQGVRLRSHLGSTTSCNNPGPVP